MILERDYQVVIVGAGVAGLSCARLLAEHGVKYLVLEKSDRPGGRIKTDYLDGYQLDHGFQVVQTGYPGLCQQLDLKSLSLRPFPAGVTIRYGGRFHAVADPRRHPEHLLSTVAAPIGSFGDRMRMLRMAVSLRREPMQKIFEEPEESTAEFLKHRRFSKKFITSFFTPFFAGASLDTSLETSSRVLKYVTRLFATGDAALPRDGMAAIPDQLASGLPRDSLRFECEVVAIEPGQVRLADSTPIKADKIVCALPQPVLSKLLEVGGPAHSVGEACIYFSSRWRPPFKNPFLLLNGEGRGPINNIAFPSLVSPSYAPEGVTLIAAVVLDAGHRADADLVTAVRSQCREWFGKIVDDWQHVGTYLIEHALPRQLVPTANPYVMPEPVSEKLIICGEYGSLPGLQWAMMSGEMAGRRIVEQGFGD